LPVGVPAVATIARATAAGSIRRPRDLPRRDEIVRAKSLILATGVSWRRVAVEGL
jgi:alkyl hydroperoxide reductase subunit AhpF